MGAADPPWPTLEICGASVDGAIGSGWRRDHRSQLGYELIEQLEKIPEEFWGDVRLDVELVLPR